MSGKEPEPIITLHTEASNLIISEGSNEDILNQCATGLATCRTLGTNGGHDEIALATQIVTTYIPMLSALMNIPQHLHRAARLLSAVYQILQANAYHLASTTQSLSYAKAAVHYARLGEDATTLVIALHELASVYEWPLPGLPKRVRNKQALELIEEAVHIQEAKQHQAVPARVRAWNYVGQAKFQALNGMRRQVYTSIGKAYTTYPKQHGAITGLYFNDANLVRQAAIAYSYLSEQEKAVGTFLQTIDANDTLVSPKLCQIEHTLASSVRS